MTWEVAAREVGEALGNQSTGQWTPDAWCLWAIGRATTLRAEYAALVDELDRVNTELEALKQSRRWWERFFR